uniref:C-type lectin domain-containing protein n=1 Tax=Phasianus colchicus TaxID=9054 RepID=A0A669Q659_PHACC
HPLPQLPEQDGQISQPSCSPRSHFSHVCPNAWLGFQGKCYYFSNTESDWNSSRKHCQRLGASLATVDTEEEKVRAGREPQSQHRGGKL